MSGTVQVKATASDNTAVGRVEFYDGTTLIGMTTTSPYAASWNTASVSSGSHTLKARASDTAGNSKDSAAITVSVTGGTDKTPPTVALSAPASGAPVSGAVTVSATAADNVGVARVEFYRDSTTLLGTDTTSPYSTSWDSTMAAAGSHTLKAIAYDAAGNSTTSSSRSVTVKDVTAPTVAISAPTNGANVSVGSTVNIAANVSDATGVTKVLFYVNNALTCTDTASPFSCAWKVPTATGKSYALSAKAYDAAGNNRASATVTVTSR